MQKQKSRRAMGLVMPSWECVRRGLLALGFAAPLVLGPTLVASAPAGLTSLIGGRWQLNGGLLHLKPSNLIKVRGGTHVRGSRHSARLA